MPAAYDTSTGLRAMTGGSQVLDIDAGFLALAQDVAARLPTVVTTLPGAPYDGQEIYLQTSPGLYWHLRYRAAASTYKWEWLGGSALYNTTATAVSIGSTTYAGSGTGIQVPLIGRYTVEFGGAMKVTAGVGYLGVRGGTSTAPADPLAAVTESTSRVSVAYKANILVSSPADLLVELCHRASAGVVDSTNRWLYVYPTAVI